jgi:hypothetical protein
MNVNKRNIDEVTTTRKRQFEGEYSEDAKRRDIGNDQRQFEHTEIRFDFVVEK